MTKCFLKLTAIAILWKKKNAPENILGKMEIGLKKKTYENTHGDMKTS